MKIIHDVERLSEYWWVVLLRGVFALVFSAAVWVATGVLHFDYGSSIALVFIQACFGTYLLVAGLFSQRAGCGLARCDLPRQNRRKSVLGGGAKKLRKK